MTTKLTDYEREQQIARARKEIANLQGDIAQAIEDREKAKRELWENLPTSKLLSKEFSMPMMRMDEAEKVIASAGRKIVNREKKIRELT